MNIQVMCRFRPLPVGEKEINMQINENTVTVDGTHYTFDRVFSPGTQREVFKAAAEPVIESVLEGFNGTVVAYGQTASGKTHTMEGYGDQPGIIRQMVNTVFDYIERSEDHQEFQIKVSVVELYMEKFRDLQNPKKVDLRLREDKSGQYIQDVTETYVSEQQEIYDIMKLCNQSRQVSHTNMNEQSSRSHMIFQMIVKSTDNRDQSAKIGKLFLVDLAGSEKVSKTGAEGKTLDEANGINLSLSTLGQVINALTKNQTHIPYRSSKLTRILQSSFGGNSKTTLIVTASMANVNFQETLTTLRFGTRAKTIKNKPKVNKEHTIEELKQIIVEKDKEITILQESLAILKHSNIDPDLQYKIEDITETRKQSYNAESLMLEQECENLRQRNFQQEQHISELKNTMEQIKMETQEDISASNQKIQLVKNQFKSQLGQISRNISQIIGNISEDELIIEENLTKLINNFIKEKMTSKLQQLTYLYRKHHRDNINPQLLSFLTDYTQDFNIQNDQMQTLETQLNILKQQNQQLSENNDSQKDLLAAFQQTKDLLEAEKIKSSKLEAKYNKLKQYHGQSLIETDREIANLMSGVLELIDVKNQAQKSLELAQRKVQVREKQIVSLQQEISRLSEENQKLFVKYDTLHDLDDSMVRSKKIQRPIKGGKFTTPNHKTSMSMQIYDKENEGI